MFEKLKKLGVVDWFMILAVLTIAARIGMSEWQLSRLNKEVASLEKQLELEKFRAQIARGQANTDSEERRICSDRLQECWDNVFALKRRPYEECVYDY